MNINPLWSVLEMLESTDFFTSVIFDERGVWSKLLGIDI